MMNYLSICAALGFGAVIGLISGFIFCVYLVITYRTPMYKEAVRVQCAQCRARKIVDGETV